MPTEARRIVLGIGNTLNRDEGIGVYALRALEARLGRPRILEFLDGGVLGFGLLPIVEAASHLLVLDAVDAGHPPGSVIELRGEEIPKLAGIRVSQHQITFQEVLGIATIRDKLPPHLHLIGIQPADISIGTTPSPVVAAALDEVVARAIVLLGEWGVLDWARSE